MFTRALIILVLVCAAGVAGWFGAPLAALIAGFAAVALVIDSVVPATGFLRVDSRHAFQRLVWQRRRGLLGGWGAWRRDQGRLELLSGGLERSAGRRHLGIQPVAIDSIIGTVEAEKAVAFDGVFRPPRGSRGRWELMWIACRRGDWLPPISVYRLYGRHYVIDGHHRVSVARSLTAASIDADVIELLPMLGSPGVPQRPSQSRSSPSLVRRAAIQIDQPAPLPMSPIARKRETRTGRVLLSLLLCLAVGLGLTLLAGAFTAVPGYLLILAACVCIGRGLGSPDTTGLKDHRQ